jgi:hypothetical protein
VDAKRGGINADGVYTDESTIESVERKPKGVDEDEVDKVVKVFFFKLSVQPDE